MSLPEHLYSGELHEFSEEIKTTTMGDAQHYLRIIQIIIPLFHLNMSPVQFLSRVHYRIIQ